MVTEPSSVRVQPDDAAIASPISPAASTLARTPRLQLVFDTAFLGRDWAILVAKSQPSGK
jgi:hypothetical protein